MNRAQAAPDGADLPRIGGADLNHCPSSGTSTPPEGRTLKMANPSK
jgi:hypothetical protein